MIETLCNIIMFIGCALLLLATIMLLVPDSAYPVVILLLLSLILVTISTVGMLVAKIIQAMQGE